MKQSYFCNFDIKHEFLDPQNLHVAIFRHQNQSEMELQHYFQNSGAKSPCSGQKFKLITWKPLEVFEKKIALFIIIFWQLCSLFMN